MTGPYTSDPGTQILDLDEPIKARSFLPCYIRSGNLRAPGLHISDLGAQILDLDELFIASPFLT